MVPRSIKHENAIDCDSKVPLEISRDPLPVGQELKVTYTYSVTYTVSFYTIKIIYTCVVSHTKDRHLHILILGE